MNFVFAILIGAVIGAVGGYLIRGRQATAVWMSPLLAIVGVGVTWFLGNRSTAATS